ncbi:MAG: hypothetical protein OXC80_10465 [Gammaproteobacteria bacterium]|nr:hypothetical protein [Gammaproteobacteria bacterium]
MEIAQEIQSDMPDLNKEEMEMRESLSRLPACLEGVPYVPFTSGSEQSSEGEVFWRG